MNAMVLMIGVLCVLATAYAIYSRFLAYRVLQLDDSRQTPAYTLNDGHNYHPTNKWVLFGHHFAAISGAGPLIGPVLAAQFGYLPGLLWILIGVCLGGAVQDFTVLVLSIRRGGRSLAHIAHDEIGKVSGMAAMVGVLFVLVVALAGLGMIVVKALGGETVSYPVGTQFVAPAKSQILPVNFYDDVNVYRIPAGSQIKYPPINGQRVSVPVGQAFDVEGHAGRGKAFPNLDVSAGTLKGQVIEIKPGTTGQRRIDGSTWGAFTIFLTVPIALLTGLYMYRIRKGKVLEASIVGGLMTLGAVYLGAAVADPQHWINEYLPLCNLAPTFNLSEHGIAHAMAIYGFVASILPVWMLLCPRDYLSSFLKIGTVSLLVIGVIVANPKLQAPAINDMFLSGGPILGKTHGIFPFVFITIMCGAISGFHSLVSSGTTPKMIKKETDARPIGYGAMLIEGLVGIVALIAAASLPNAFYYNMNTAWKILPAYQQQIVQLSETDQLQTIKDQAGERKEDLTSWEGRVHETLTGRTGGAVTLAVGMARIFDGAAKNVLGLASEGVKQLEAMIPYWYHFAIMFEALFILTTIDTGTRVGRFVLQELFGKISPRWGKTDYWPSAILSTGLLVLGWWWFLVSNSVESIWPMFGIANQLLAVMALGICSVTLVRGGKAGYVWPTLVPMVFVTITTLTTAVIMLNEMRQTIADATASSAMKANAGLSAVVIVGIVACTLVVLVGGLRRVLRREPVLLEAGR